MILSVSRRTDIPAFYSEWFYNRIKEGFVYVRNPMNIHNISKITLDPSLIDCIVFWTKNPQNMLSRLDELKDYNYYFQFTINPYDQTLEKGVPRKKEIFETFKRLSDRIGPDRVIWRYDPIIFSDHLDSQYHEKYFEVIAKSIGSYTNRCVISFLDLYKKTERNIMHINAKEFENIEYSTLCNQINNIASNLKIEVQTCAEKVDLLQYGISHGCCIDYRLIEAILNKNIDVRKDKNQREECGCVESVDIGQYNSCKHNCLYCYANFNNDKVIKSSKLHDPLSPLLVGNIEDKDVVKDRKMTSIITKNLFK